MGFIFDCLLDLVSGLFGWGLLLPLFWLLATPFIVVIAFCRREPFWESVPRMFGGVTEFWKDWGSFW